MSEPIHVTTTKIASDIVGATESLGIEKMVNQRFPDPSDKDADRWYLATCRGTWHQNVDEVISKEKTPPSWDEEESSQQSPEETRDPLTAFNNLDQVFNLMFDKFLCSHLTSQEHSDVSWKESSSITEVQARDYDDEDGYVRVQNQKFWENDTHKVTMNISGIRTSKVLIEVASRTYEGHLRAVRALSRFAEECAHHTKLLEKDKDVMFYMGAEDIISLPYSKVEWKPENYPPLVGNQFFPLINEIKNSYQSTAGRLVILEGPPGTGKTYFCCALTHALKKRARWIRISPQAAQSISLIERLISFRNSNDMHVTDPLVLLIEDGDLAILHRDTGNLDILSSILDLTSGTTGMSLNLTVVVTTNAERNKHDLAIIRPGRLLRSIGFQPLTREEYTKVLTLQLDISEDSISSLGLGESATLAQVYAAARVLRDKDAQERDAKKDRESGGDKKTHGKSIGF